MLVVVLSIAMPGGEPRDVEMRLPYDSKRECLEASQGLVAGASMEIAGMTAEISSRCVVEKLDKEDDKATEREDLLRI